MPSALIKTTYIQKYTVVKFGDAIMVNDIVLQSMNSQNYKIFTDEMNRIQ